MVKENNHNEKRNQKITILIGLITLLVAVLGATYAYFQINTNNESSNTTITGSTPPNSLVTLIPGTDNLHINLSASDMAQANATKEYYATDAEDKSYEDNESDGTKTIAKVELTGGEESLRYSCTAKLTISKVSDSEETDTIIDALTPGDMILQFKGNIINEKLDLSELKENNPKEYTLNFKMAKDKEKNIQAYIKLINKDEPQNYLANKKLNIDISTSDLKCDMYKPEQTINILRKNDTNSNLSEDLQGGIYRYQGINNVPNWICFGTTNKDECTNDPDGIDKYMYRIIGINDEGQMYLIKETFLREGETRLFTWNDRYYVDPSESKYCLNGQCSDWPQSLLFQRINGTSNGEQSGEGIPVDQKWTNLFVDSKEYDYLKSNNSSKASDWYNLIADHEWLYGDTNDIAAAQKYNGDAMYEIEHGEKETTHLVGVKDNISQETYTWTQKVKSKIGLMYLHDYYYSYYDGINEESRGNPENYINAKNSWIYFEKDGYNTGLDCREWLMTRYGVYDLAVYAWFIYRSGAFGWYDFMDLSSGVRPVFYLNSSAEISTGDGTKTNPYILEI